MNKSFSPNLNTFLLLIVLLLVGYVSVKFHDADNAANELKEQIIERRMEREYVLDLIGSNVRYEGQVLALPDKRDTVLVCYYSDMSCQSCVMFAREKVRSVVGDKSLFVLFNKDKAHSISRNEDFVIEESTIDNANQVAYFILENNVVRNYFVPDKQRPEYTDMYLHWIKEKYNI